MRKLCTLAAAIVLVGQGCVLPWETRTEVVNVSEATISVTGAIRRSGKVPALCTVQKAGDKERLVMDTRFNGWQILSILPKAEAEAGKLAPADAMVGFTVDEGTFRASETPEAKYDAATRTFTYSAPMRLQETGETLRLTLSVTCQDTLTPVRRR